MLKEVFTKFYPMTQEPWQLVTFYEKDHRFPYNYTFLSNKNSNIPVVRRWGSSAWLSRWTSRRSSTWRRHSVPAPVGRGSVVSWSAKKNKQYFYKYFIYISHHFTAREDMNSTNWPCSQWVTSQLSWSSIAPVLRRSQFRILLKWWYFFRLLPSNCLNWKLNWDDHSSLSSTTAVQYEF